MKTIDLTTPEPASQTTASGPPADAAEAGAAFVLSLALGSTAVTPAAALDLQRQRVEALRDPTAPAALDELARQLPLLEALFHRFTAESLRTKNPDDRARLLRAALQAQQAHSRTFGLLRGLQLQSRGQALVNVDDDDSDDAPDNALDPVAALRLAAGSGRGVR